MLNKSNNKITELRTILQRESQNSKIYKHKISQQPENCENRNDPDLVQAFLKWSLLSKNLVERQPLHITFDVLSRKETDEVVAVIFFYLNLFLGMTNNSYESFAFLMTFHVCMESI